MWQFLKISKQRISISVSVLAVSVIPLQKDKWIELKFNKIQPNQVEDSAEGLKVSVDSSASPLVFKLVKPLKVIGFSADIETNGNIKDRAMKNSFGEDSIFRLGLVATGDKKLGWLQRQVAADWVQKLFALVPETTGLDQIYFFNVGREDQVIGQSRQHPKSDLMFEQIVQTRKSDQKLIHFEHKLKKPLTAAALWISIDGDDTKSNFTTVIKKIELLIEESSLKDK